MEEDGGERAQRRHPTSSETLISEPHLDPPSTCSETTLHPGEEDRTESKPELNQTEIFRTLEVVERDSLSIADSFTTLFASLRLALSEVSPAFYFSLFSSNLCLVAEKVKETQGKLKLLQSFNFFLSSSLDIR